MEERTPRTKGDPTASPAPGRLTVRMARPEDVEGVWAVLAEFTSFEKLERSFTGSRERLAANLFGGAWPPLDCLVAEDEGRLVGLAIVMGAYSTFWTRPLNFMASSSSRATRHA